MKHAKIKKDDFDLQGQALNMCFYLCLAQAQYLFYRMAR